jgi:hypothetical protein
MRYCRPCGRATLEEAEGASSRLCDGCAGQSALVANGFLYENADRSVFDSVEAAAFGAQIAPLTAAFMFFDLAKERCAKLCALGTGLEPAVEQLHARMWLGVLAARATTCWIAPPDVGDVDFGHQIS